MNRDSKNKNTNMALTIELPSNIEQQLRQGATQKGISLENYLLQLLSHATSSPKKQVKKKPISELSENELLQKINLDITEAEWMTYHRLTALRKAEKITESDYAQLIQLGEKIENANVVRLKYLVALSKKRNVSLDKVMADLGLLRVES